MESTVTITLNEHQVYQILTALLNRGDNKNGDPQWAATAEQFAQLNNEFKHNLGTGPV
jgi:hypothetical protein